MLPSYTCALHSSPTQCTPLCSLCTLILLYTHFVFLLTVSVTFSSTLCFSTHCECYIFIRTLIFTHRECFFFIHTLCLTLYTLHFYKIWMNSESFTSHTTLQTLCTTLYSSDIHSSHFCTLHFAYWQTSHSAPLESAHSELCTLKESALSSLNTKHSALCSSLHSSPLHTSPL